MPHQNEPGDRFVYSVVFFFAPLAEHPRQRLFLFSSLAAIYDLFSVEQIGCGLGRLYNLKLPSGGVYQSEKVIIRREKVFCKRQNRV
jgi:hypothetical protein